MANRINSRPDFEKKVCLIYNFALHYRSAIFQLLDKDIKCDFYFGDSLGDLKKMDYTLLINFKKELKNVRLIKAIYWQKGAVNLFFKNYDTYIILGEYYCISTWILLFLCKFSKKKIFLWTHGWYGNESMIKRVIKKLFYSLGDGMLLYGNYARELMIKEGFKPSKLNVVYNSLDYSLQCQIRKNLKNSTIFSDYFKNDYPVLIFVGRLTKEKKLEQLIQANSLLLKKGIYANLVFVGTGAARNDLRQQILKTEQNNYWLYGECYEETKLAELIFNSTVCVSPGNVGLTAMHSLVYGTPVITHNDFANQMPEFEAIIPGETGDFFIKDNIADLSNFIGKWIGNMDNREDVRKSCFDIIDKFYNPTFQLQVIKKVINVHETTIEAGLS